jgi:hypothetical protein
MRRHSRHRARLAAIAAIGLLFFAPNAQAQVSSITTKPLGRIDSRRITEGMSFFVRTISEWNQGQCRIPLGMTLEGRIAKVTRRAPGVKREEISLSFLHIPCSGNERRQLIPILSAIHGSQKELDDSMLDHAALSGLFAAAVGGHPVSGASGPGGTAPPANGYGGVIPQTSRRDVIRAGEVRDYPGVKIALPTYLSDPTIVYASGEIFFDPDARFILVVRLTENAPAVETVHAAPPSPQPATTSGGNVENPARSLPVSAPFTVPALVENCVSGGCATAADTSHVTAERAQTEVPLRTLAYRPRIGRTVRGGLEDDSAVAFLGDDQVLVTFSTHPLIPRNTQEAIRTTTPRRVRGVLVSSVNGRTLGVTDWDVPDAGAYLWPLNRGRVLAHIGDALVIYGRDLREEARLDLAGPLLFVTISPSRNIILIAVAHERYDAETFRRLADFVGSAEAVQEDCDLIALNGQLEQTSSRRLTQIPARPWLLDSGIVSIVQERGSQWKIEETDWNNHEKRVTELASGCAPLLEPLPGNLLFVSGCKEDSRSKWFRVLRADGKTLLRGTASNATIPEYVAAPASGDVFAVGVEHSLSDVDWATGMFIGDLTSMTVAVYRASDGKRVYATKVHSHAVDRRVFALSDSGERLAVLADDSVHIYRTGQTP